MVRNIFGLRSILICVLIMVAGCTARYHATNLDAATSPQLDRGKGVYVAIPQDGAYANRNYAGSGQTVAQAVAVAFSGLAKQVQIADRHPQQLEESIAAAKSAGAGYVAVPVIAHWEHRNTTWSGLPSRMAIRLTIFDLEGKQLASSAIEGRSRIVSMSGTSPESLLKGPVREYVRGLY